MYPVFLEANSVCGILGACGLKSVVKVPTCDECTGSITAVAGVIESEAQIAEIVAFLQVSFYSLSTALSVYLFPARLTGNFIWRQWDSNNLVEF